MKVKDYIKQLEKLDQEREIYRMEGDEDDKVYAAPFDIKTIESYNKRNIFNKITDDHEFKPVDEKSYIIC